MARNAQLVRALKLILILRAGWCDLGSLAEALSVTTRTVRRDIQALIAADLPVHVHRLEDDELRTMWRMVGL